MSEGQEMTATHYAAVEGPNLRANETRTYDARRRIAEALAANGLKLPSLRADYNSATGGLISLGGCSVAQAEGLADALERAAERLGEDVG